MLKLKRIIIQLIVLVVSLNCLAQDYATIYVYRKKKLSATGIDFKIYLNGLEIAQIPNGGRLEYRYYKEGNVKLMAGIYSEYHPMADNHDNVLTLEVKKGESYYFLGEGKTFRRVSDDVGKSAFMNDVDFDDKPFIASESEKKDIDNSSSNKTSNNNINSKPPKILITSPVVKNGGIFNTDNTTFIIKGTAGSMAGIYEVKVNREDAAVNKDGDFTSPQSLNIGNNEFFISAKDVNGLTSDFSFTIVCSEPVAKSNLEEQKEESLYRGGGDPLKGMKTSSSTKNQLVTGNYYALIIGIDKYKGTWMPLKNAVNDAKAIETSLRESYRIDKFKTLYNESATRTNIITEMEWLVDNVKENDNVLIYYSGHGQLKKELNKGFWVPVDATTNSTSNFISNSDLQTFIAGIKSKHTLLISDACFSGDIFRGNTVSIPFESSEKYYTKVYENKSREAISSGGIEPVMDGGKQGHSVFAYYLLQALTNNSAKYFDSGQLFEKIKIPVTNNSEQTPNFNPIKNASDEGGHFIFIRK
jgi:Caspase domain